MSDTTIDMPKVTQMLDAGWQLEIYKNGMGSYTVMARHGVAAVMARLEEHLDDDGDLITDDFTPEQALTRMAYKVHGEII